MFLSAFILRRWAVNALGDYHSIHIEIRANHPLIKNGPYAYLRHPYYLSVILELLGLPLVGNAFFSFVISLFLYVPFLLLRVYLEEQVMINKFNGEYIKYKKNTPGFLPIIKLVS
jgi:methyltransferase